MSEIKNNISYEQVRASAIASRANNEANLRKQLAYLYRIFNHYGWDDLIVTHLSVRLAEEEALLILPFGLSFDEITPENLIKVDFAGNILTSTQGFNINQNGTTVHRSIYKARPEINCILHTHSHYGVVMSSLQEELQFLDQIAMMFYNKLGYHDFEKLFINDNEQQQLLHDIEGKNSMILKNHGLLSVGKTLVEAFWFHYYLELSCKNQVSALSTNSKLKLPDIEIIKATSHKYDTWRDKNEHVELSDSELLFEAAKRKVGYIFG